MWSSFLGSPGEAHRVRSAPGCGGPPLPAHDRSSLSPAQHPGALSRAGQPRVCPDRAENAAGAEPPLSQGVGKRHVAVPGEGGPPLRSLDQGGPPRNFPWEGPSPLTSGSKGSRAVSGRKHGFQRVPEEPGWEGQCLVPPASCGWGPGAASLQCPPCHGHTARSAQPGFAPRPGDPKAQAL